MRGEFDDLEWQAKSPGSPRMFTKLQQLRKQLLEQSQDKSNVDVNETLFSDGKIMTAMQQLRDSEDQVPVLFAEPRKKSHVVQALHKIKGLSKKEADPIVDDLFHAAWEGSDDIHWMDEDGRPDPERMARGCWNLAPYLAMANMPDSIIPHTQRKVMEEHMGTMLFKRILEGMFRFSDDFHVVYDCSEVIAMADVTTPSAAERDRLSFLPELLVHLLDKWMDNSDMAYQITKVAVEATTSNALARTEFRDRGGYELIFDIAQNHWNPQLDNASVQDCCKMAFLALGRLYPRSEDIENTEFYNLNDIAWLTRNIKLTPDPDMKFLIVSLLTKILRAELGEAGSDSVQSARSKYRILAAPEQTNHKHSHSTVRKMPVRKHFKRSRRGHRSRSGRSSHKGKAHRSKDDPADQGVPEPEFDRAIAEIGHEEEEGPGTAHGGPMGGDTTRGVDDFAHAMIRNGILPALNVTTAGAIQEERWAHATCSLVRRLAEITNFELTSAMIMYSMMEHVKRGLWHNLAPQGCHETGEMYMDDAFLYNYYRAGCAQPLAAQSCVAALAAMSWGSNPATKVHEILENVPPVQTIMHNNLDNSVIQFFGSAFMLGMADFISKQAWTPADRSAVIEGQIRTSLALFPPEEPQESSEPATK